MKKIILLLGAVLLLASSVVRADTGGMRLTSDSTNSQGPIAQTGELQLGVATDATLTGHGSDFVHGLNRAPGASFAQLEDGSRSVPPSMMWFFGVVASAVLAGRVLALHRAKAMADHEHQTHHARSQMYRILHQRD